LTRFLHANRYRLRSKTLLTPAAKRCGFPIPPICRIFLPQLSIAGLAAGGVKRRIGACLKASFRPGTA
jgi:hypothetical protein